MQHVSDTSPRYSKRNFDISQTTEELTKTGRFFPDLMEKNHAYKTNAYLSAGCDRDGKLDPKLRAG
jgi:hypothetical protein